LVQAIIVAAKKKFIAHGGADGKGRCQMNGVKPPQGVACDNLVDRLVEPLVGRNDDEA